MYKRRTSPIIYIFIIVFLFIFIFPFFVEVTVALKHKIDLFQFPIKWLPHPPQWKIFLEIWEIIPLWHLFGNTYSVILLTLVLNLCIAIPAGYALSSLDFIGKKIIILLALISQMFIPVLIIVPIFELVKSSGMMDTRWALVLVNSAFSVAFITLLLKGFFDKIPTEIEEAALIDGCNRFNTLYRIYIPISKSGIVVAAIYNTILVNNEFLFANTLIMSDTKNMMIVALYKLIKSNPYAWEITMNHVMTAAIFAALPIQIMFLYIRKYLTKGLLAGAIK